MKYSVSNKLIFYSAKNENRKKHFLCVCTYMYYDTYTRQQRPYGQIMRKSEGDGGGMGGRGRWANVTRVSNLPFFKPNGLLPQHGPMPLVTSNSNPISKNHPGMPAYPQLYLLMSSH